MAITAAELKAYGSLNMPESDTTTSGGGIDTTCMIEFADLAVNDVVRAVSTNAGDTTQTAAVTGRTAAGAIVTDNIALNGTTPVAGTTTFQRVLKIILSATAAGTVTVERNTTPFDDVIAIPTGVTKVRRLFYDSASEAGATARYEKVFFKNTNATLTLNAAKTQLTADPSAKIKIANATTVSDTGSVANRKTLPAGLTWVDDNVAQDVPGQALAAGAAIGVWAELSLTAGDSPLDSTFTLELSGTTT